MAIHPKSNEVLQAQVAHYADSKVAEAFMPDYAAADLVFKRLGRDSLALLASTDAASDANNDEYQDYLQFMRSSGEKDRTSARKEAEMLSRYSEFAGPIESLQADIESGKAHPIGSGKRSIVYKLEHSGTAYAIRFVEPRYDNAARIIHDHMSGALAGEGLKGLEQFVTASYEKRTVISELVKGNHTADMSPEEIRAISQEQLEDLVNSRVKASEKGIKFDAVNGNTFYDPIKGFTDIDYSAGGKPLDKMQAFVQVFLSLSLNRAEVLADDTEKSPMAEKKAAVYDLVNTYFRNNFTGSEVEIVAEQLQLARATEVADAKLEIWHMQNQSKSA